MNVIEIKNLTVAYGEGTVLENINLEIEKGDFIALVGPNGAGKSTLIKTILDFLKPITGTIKINGKSYREERKKVAYVPQRGSVDWDFPTTLFDVVEMGSYGRVGFFKRVSKEEKEKVKKAIAQVDMLEFMDRQISQLSGGQQQRAFLARALVQDADIYLMDEPFQGVDAKTEKAIVAILKKLKTENKTVLVVHHDLQTVTSYFDKVILINKMIIEKGRVEDVFTEENIEKTYKKSEEAYD
ncbi:metal ABC transporter ATP-binding protein [Fusobacterium russii]|uniref:metal ABC transporter ATP-binding protein n=1 Tax=Fusobacterium russii TaxID=854 RepID=UPI00039B7976|nr:metal ABC transporter ATP-binding protein [Fusobacterium russii]